MTWIDQRGSEVLSHNECLRLLMVGAGGVGRVGMVSADRAVIEPVLYRMLDRDIVVQVGPGSILETARRSGVVSFEIDSLTQHEAWSVLARGPAREVAAEVVSTHARPPGGRPIVPEPGSSFVSIRTDVLSGRRFPIRVTVDLTESTGRRLSEVDLRPPVRIGRSATIAEAAAVMESEGISSVLLGDHPAWLVSERDLVGAMASGLDPGDPAADVAMRTPLWVTTTTTVADAAAIMAHHCVQHLVVIGAAAVPVGVISRREALRQLLDERAARVAGS